MTKYAAIEFNKLSEAIAYIEDGGELYMKRNSNHGYGESNICEVSKSDLCIYDFWNDSTLCTKAQPAPWYEKLDGTIENGVLCWVDDEPSLNVCRSHVSLIVTRGADGFVDNMDTYWEYAVPLTRTEIQKFMNNAPEEK